MLIIRSFNRYIIIGLMMILPGTAISATIVDWGAAGGSNANGFDNASITFAAIQAGSVTITESDGFFGDHGTNDGNVFSLQLLLDGTWTTIWSQVGDCGVGNCDQAITSITTPISFTSASVTGIQFLSSTGIYWAYHHIASDWNGNGRTTSFEFISPVPVPAAVWLFGTAMIGLVGFGKRRKAA